MIRNPISTVATGGYSVYGASTHHAALVYAPNPDSDGVSRPEPDTAELILGYGYLGSVAGVKAYIRGGGAYALNSQLAAQARLYDGSTLLAQVDFTLYDYTATHTITFPVSNLTISNARLGLRTFEFLPQERMPAPDYSNFTMAVLDDDPQSSPPPFRQVRLTPAREYVSPYWVMEIITNHAAGEPVPTGFAFLGSPDGVRVSGSNLLLPDVQGEESRFIVWLREV
jgi:hypothetical protein